MTTMRVKDLIEILQTIDPELPIHKHSGGGEFEAIAIDYAGHWINYGSLMQSKNAPTFFTKADDEIFNEGVRRHGFGEKFKAVIVW